MSVRPARFIAPGLVLAVQVLLASPGAGLAQERADAGAPVLRLAPSPRADALGGAFVAAGAGDALGVLANPAAGSVASGAGAAFRRHPGDVAAGSAAGTLPILLGGRLVVAVQYLDLGEVDVLEPDPAYGGQRGEPTGERAGGSDAVGTFGYAVRIGRVGVGAAVKGLRTDIAGLTGETFAADAGVLAALAGGRLVIGAAALNLGGEIRAGRSAPLPRTFSGGAAYRFDIVAGVGGLVTAEGVARGGVLSPRGGAELRIGGEPRELPPPGAETGGWPRGVVEHPGLVLRLGFDGTARSQDALSGLTGGVGVLLGGWRIDYGLRDLGPLGWSHQLGFNVTLDP